MKRILFSILAFVLSSTAYSQTILENPRHGMNTATYLKLDKIELRDTATVLWFHINASSNTTFFIPKETFIQPVGSKQKLYVVDANGVELGGQFAIPESGGTNYQLIFPRIDASVTKVDYGEANEGGNWFIYDIQLKPELFKSLLPEKITGNWFLSDNAQWEISLLDSVAVYKSQVWKYKKYAEKDGLGKISLESGAKALDIYAKLINDSTCMLGENPEKLNKHTNKPNESAMHADQELFKLPVFKLDTVTYCGYIHDFSPRFPQRTGMVYVNDVLTGEQASYTVKIADDGTFRIEFPNINPQFVYVRHPFYNETIFLEPGKATFQLFDLGNKTNQVLFMGDCARINNDLLILNDINSFNYYQMQEKILDFTPEQYKAYCLEMQQKDLDSLSKLAKVHSLSAQAVQVKKMQIVYRYSSILFEYAWKAEEAWRKKNNTPREQREIPFKPVTPDSAYYTFLDNDLVNNPLAVLSSEFSSFINRLKYLDLLRGVSKNISTYEIMEELERSGYQFTPEEKELKDAVKGMNSPELKKVQEEFQAKYGNDMNEFFSKYSVHMQALLKEKNGLEITPDMFVEYLSGQKVELSEAELELIVALESFNENPLIKENMQAQKKVSAASNKFHNDHREFVNGLFREQSISQRNEKIQTVLGIQPGFATDVMMSQDFCRPIVSEMTPVSDEKLNTMQEKISTPFIASYIGIKNNEAKAKVEANKKLKGAVVMDAPKAGGDNIFDAIMAKYKGKVVYVDFWATWCAPCRSGIERIKPLKEEMAGEDVVFVYITNQTSPKGTYDNMIPSIKGEHYRVSPDEWNILCGKFNISGIPHYVLVGKDGQVINPKVGWPDNSQLKTLLMKSIND